MLDKVDNDGKLDEVLKELPEDKRDVLISAFYAVVNPHRTPLTTCRPLDYIVFSAVCGLFAKSMFFEMGKPINKSPSILLS